MARDHWQKIKLLKLLELLKQESDEAHPMTTSQICNRMAQMDIPCDRRTLSVDVQILNEWRFEVMTKSVGRERGYYVEERSFSVPEIKIMIDATQAATFITEKKTEELTTKLAELAGSHMADVLEENMVFFNTKKHSNESIYYNVDAIERAIQEKKKVIFKYFDIDSKREKDYRRGGHHYVVEPVALVFNEDNYYLVAYSSKHDNTANYRIDRMDSVDPVDEPMCEKALELREEVSEYMDSAFKMYGGPLQSIVLEFDKCLIGVVYDKFGESTTMMEAGEDRYVATMKVQISPTFWGWIFQFGNKMKIISPDVVIEKYKKKLEEIK
ncbi:MAG: helix-turn-helix transcriptional regulator [Eggerthia catenaformis]|uniref:helix-turn-helix transcriptional regulator n=1 Tax=Eggerthia catenaformis TaxID=31973 RepID=UPI003FA11198